MKKNLAAYLALLFATTWSSAAISDEIFNNGSPAYDSTRCISGPSQCGDFTGKSWAVYDDFILASNSVITGFSNWNGFGQISDYVSTSWSIWSGLHILSNNISLGGVLIAAGTNTGEIHYTDGFNKVTIGGLNIDLEAGIYWLGISHTLKSDSPPYSFVMTENKFAGNAIQSLESTFALQYPFDSAFTVNGYFNNDQTLTVPEPESSALFIAGTGLLSFFSCRRKLKGLARATPLKFL